ncbi:TetR/AcrR family transcriptional regulator [Priestia filamentosa]|nr:TetR/AcrR family transcriptional regulator [Priestia filamentosa]MDT3762271.1 helix-turn-helix domain-containing protein [Priestia filamentosa]OXS68839.1 TetR family transcriptional regulator [Priestia filamentosa]RJS64458.1 TetR/AcrR family transcriptional regulator [Priestia filamentosa]WCM17351.1 helix-turn-helix domain containing protein [Priestia filamentosa]WRU96757.1 helix-turn-helix domain-containing protein [Priestia filamentosa]
MPRQDQQNKQIRDERRAQILQAALRVFARRGMVAAKISDIAKEAKLSHGLVYHYFKSKEEIFMTLVQKALESSLNVIYYANEQVGTPLEKLRWMTEQIMKSINNGEEVLLFLIMIQASTSDIVSEEVKEILTGEHAVSPVMATIPLIMEGQKVKEIKQEDPVQLAVTYYAFIQGLAINKIQWEECPMPEAHLIMNIFKKTP